jgi:hypothetical protein
MSLSSVPIDPTEFFHGSPVGLAIYEAVASSSNRLGAVQVQVSKSQIAFRRRRGFAYLWRPGKYVASTVPAVLSLALPRELESSRIKEIAHPSPRLWMHHFELHDPAEFDAELNEWLHEAYEAAENA